MATTTTITNNTPLSLSSSFVQLLPSQVLAYIFGFLNGKTISTFMIVAWCNQELHPIIVPLCRGILVQRFIELAKQYSCSSSIDKHTNNHHTGNTSSTVSTMLEDGPEIKVVLDAVREDIRRSNIHHQYDAGTAVFHHTTNENDGDEDINIVTKLSEWFGILDYFEIHWNVYHRIHSLIEATTDTHSTTCTDVHCSIPQQWIVWIGTLEIPYGETDVYLVTNVWTMDALLYWRNRELAILSFTHSRNRNLQSIHLPWYGTVGGIQGKDQRRIQLQHRDLAKSYLHRNDQNVYDLVLDVRCALVPMNEVYEDCPTIALANDMGYNTEQCTSSSPLTKLECFWDSDISEVGDWEEGIARLGEHVLRVLKGAVLVNPDGMEHGLEELLLQTYT